MAKKVNMWLFWTPRILSIIFILFLAIFSLDVFEGNYGFWGTLLGLFMHNLPSIILTIILIISWKYDIIGAIVFIALGVGCVLGAILTIFILSINRFNFIFMIGSIVFLLTGILFLAGWLKKRKRR